MHFLRQRSCPLSRLMVSGSLTAHGMFSIALKASLKTMVTLLSAGDPLPCRQLMHDEGAALGKDEAKIKSWLVYLMEVGLLESTVAYDAASHAGLPAHVRSSARQIASQVLSNFVERAESITRQMDTDDVVQRRICLKEISEAVRDRARDAQGLQRKLEASTIFFEDAAMADHRYGLPFAGNGSFIEHLKQL